MTTSPERFSGTAPTGKLSPAVTVLLVDDDADYAYFVGEALKAEPAHFQVRVAGDAIEAKDYLEGEGRFSDRQRYPLPQLILLDANVPGWNGFDFLAWLRSGAPADCRLLPVVLMSGSFHAGDVGRAYALGANTYSPKPVLCKELSGRIGTLITCWAGHVASPSISHSMLAAKELQSNAA